MSNDDFAHELMLCFTASPVSADVNASRVYEVIKQIRKDERERCAQKAEMLGVSWRSNPNASYDTKQGAAMTCDLLASIMRGIPHDESELPRD